MKPLIVANWKMNPQRLALANQLFNSVKKGLRKIKNVEVVICPPFVYLATNKKRQATRIKLGAQNCFFKEKGAFTGEISPVMLKDLGCNYVIVGHSVRRRYFGESDEMINEKVKATLAAKLNPIFCIGEIEEERKQDKTKDVLKYQIQQGLKGISRKKIKNLIIAYEPVWAIGTGNSCKIEEAQKMGLLIRKIIAKKYSFSIAKKVKILYGGSVNSQNAKFYIAEANFHGLLIGGASLKAKEFIKIVKIVSQI